MNVKVAISSCPNDTFAFYYFLHQPPQGISFSVDYLDIENLNQAALGENSPYDIIKASFAIAPLMQKNYVLLSAGAALGFGVGPVLVGREKNLLQKLKEKKQKKIRLLLPGVYTSARFLWEYFFHREFSIENNMDLEVIQEYRVFSEILGYLQNNRADAGVLIHEGRFVYQNLGLSLLQDLGEYWEKESGLPVPLGGIFAHRRLPNAQIENLQNHLSHSVHQAREQKEKKSSRYRQEILPYVKQHAQELADDVLEKHIVYYVNDETERLSEKGREAIDFFYRRCNAQMK